MPVVRETRLPARTLGSRSVSRKACDLDLELPKMHGARPVRGISLWYRISASRAVLKPISHLPARNRGGVRIAQGQQPNDDHRHLWRLSRSLTISTRGNG